MPHELKPNCQSCIENIGFNRNAPIKFICHGFMSDYQSDINALLRNGMYTCYVTQLLIQINNVDDIFYVGYFRGNEDVNVIHVNWQALATAP